MVHEVIEQNSESDLKTARNTSKHYSHTSLGQQSADMKITIHWDSSGREVK